MNEIQREVLLENRLFLADCLKLEANILETLFDNQILDRGEIEVGQVTESI